MRRICMATSSCLLNQYPEAGVLHYTLCRHILLTLMVVSWCPMKCHSIMHITYSY